jgi:hypothetical protein
VFRYKSRDFPTVLLVSNGITIKIRTLVDAAEALLTRWPDDDGEDYVVAVRCCLDAITGVGHADIARRTFMKAAEEAGMRVIALASDIETIGTSDKDAA